MQTGVLSRGYFPSYSPNSRKWEYYGEDLRLALISAKNNKDYPRKTNNDLARLDSILIKFCKELPLRKDDLPDQEIESSEKDVFPSKGDIKLNYMEFLSSYFDENQITDFDSQYKIACNITEDIRRVIGRLMRKEPLYLISEQAEKFEKLACYLSSKPSI